MRFNLPIKFILLFFVSAVFAGFRVADDDLVKKIVEKLRIFSTTYPREKAYLHLDRGTYSVGDTVWFKAYLVDGYLHHADTASHLLYVDLIENASGEVKSVKYIRIADGSGRGDIVLNESLKGGVYTIRAYTNWMRNYKEDYFFQREIELYRSDQPNARSQAGESALDLRFFPEGGSALFGVNNRIAFKAVGGDGLGADVEGFVLKQASGDTVAGFQSTHLGMGYFNFNPEPGASYHVRARRDGRGEYKDYPLPKINSDGYHMIVDNVSHKSDVRVFVYSKGVPPGTNLSLVVHTRGMIGMAAKMKAGASGNASLSFPRKELPEGISLVTLFDDKGRPVAERVVFVDQKNRLNVSIRSNKAYFSKRERAGLEISVTDSSGKPVEANLSLAVTDANQVPEKSDEQTISSYFLLSSDLEGRIEKPDYYFDPANKDTRLKLDILMMTQGWRKFKWEEVLRDDLVSPKLPVEKGFTIEGQVTRLNSRQPGKVDLTVMLTGNDGTHGTGIAKTDEKGSFNIFNLDIRDTTKVVIQAMNQKGNRNLKIMVTPLTTPVATLIKVPYNPVTFDAEQLNEFLKKSEEYQNFIRMARARGERVLDEVTVTERRRRVGEDDGRRIYGEADATIKMSDMIIGGAENILDFIQGRVAGVVVTSQDMQKTVRIRGAQGEPTFLLDGMVVDIDAIIALSILDVETIDVMKTGASTAIFGSRGGEGVISIMTKRGFVSGGSLTEHAPGVLVYSLPGYSREKEFYAPVYNRMTPDDALRPDFRATVFWMANVRTGKDGKARVAYFNSDAVGKINVKVEGIASNGIPGTGKMQYEVR